jgi:AAA domain
LKLIFIYGLPATGKLTVAQELASMTGFKLFHNHLTVDLLLSVFEFGSPSFIKLREDIWLSVFTQACNDQLPGLIFTFAPEPTVRAEFIPNILSTIASAGGEVDFIELVCPLPELKRRIDRPSRFQYQKLTSASLLEQLHSDGSLDTAHMPKPLLSIDTSLFTPVQSAAQITQVLALGQTHPVTASTFN